jgi:hypothetical protein
VTARLVGRGRMVAAAIAVAAAAAGCVSPSPDLAAYESKAARTASAAVSQLRTVQVALRDPGRLTSAYLNVLVTGAEDAYGAVTSTFEAAQPPDDPAADRIRLALDGLLSGGGDLIGAARIAIRRGDHAAVAALAPRLADAAGKLESFDPAAVR